MKKLLIILLLSSCGEAQDDKAVSTSKVSPVVQRPIGFGFAHDHKPTEKENIARTARDSISRKWGIHYVMYGCEIHLEWIDKSKNKSGDYAYESILATFGADWERRYEKEIKEYKKILMQQYKRKS